MTAIISPQPVLAFLDNNGVPLIGGQLFTYEAGTTTKVATYTDSSGATPNTNPIILDDRGECNVWLLAGTAYKFVLAPATDTDPPTNAYWTVDNIIAPGGLLSTVTALSGGLVVVGSTLEVQSPANTIRGNNTGATAATLDLTPAQARSVLSTSEVLISSSTFSASGGPVIALGGYNRYRLEIIGLIPSGNPILTLQFSFDGGATYKAGASDYAWSVYNATTAPAGAPNGSATATAIQLNLSTMASTANKSNALEVDIYGPKATGFGLSTKHRMDFFNTTVFEQDWGAGQIIPGYGTPTNVRIVPSTGTLSGAYALYGRTGF